MGSTVGQSDFKTDNDFKYQFCEVILTTQWNEYQNDFKNWLPFQKLGFEGRNQFLKP